MKENKIDKQEWDGYCCIENLKVCIREIAPLFFYINWVNRFLYTGFKPFFYKRLRSSLFHVTSRQQGLVLCQSASTRTTADFTQRQLGQQQMSPFMNPDNGHFASTRRTITLWLLRHWSNFTSLLTRTMADVTLQLTTGAITLRRLGQWDYHSAAATQIIEGMTPHQLGQCRVTWNFQNLVPLKEKSIQSD